MSGFLQPQIKIKLFKKGAERERLQVSDPSFNKDWSFYGLVDTKPITTANAKYTCQEKEFTLQESKIVMRDKLLGPFLIYIS